MTTRSHLALLLVFIVSLSGLVGAATVDQQEVRFRWENWDAADRAFLEDRRQALTQRGATVGEVEETTPDVKNPAAVWLVLAGVTALGYLVDIIVEAVNKLNKCGMVVDSRGEETKIRRNCDLGQGDVLVVQPGGHVEKIEFAKATDPGRTELLKTLLSKGGKAK